MDNSSAIALAKNPVAHSRAKHIDIRHHFLRERVGMGELAVEHVAGKTNPADGLTKALDKEKFEWCRKEMGLRMPS